VSRHTPRRRRALSVTVAALGAAALVPLGPAPAAQAVGVGSPVRVGGFNSMVTAVSDTGRYVQMSLNGDLVRLDRRNRVTAGYTHGGAPTMSGSGRYAYLVGSSYSYRETTSGSSLRVALPTGWYGSTDGNWPSSTTTGGLAALRATSPGYGQTAPFLWNASTRTAKRLTVSTSRNAGAPSLSRNGRYVTYVSYGSSEYTGCTRCGTVWRRTVSTGGVVKVSVNRSGSTTKTGLMHGPVVSDDGRYVYFMSNATDLVSGYTSRRWRVYVRDLVTKRTRVVSSSCAPTDTGHLYGCRLSLSADGTRLSFLRKTRTGSGYGMQVFVHDLSIHRNTLASAGGSTPNGQAVSHAISGNGRRLVFSTNATNVRSGGSGTFIRALT
jgi:hypothetical protein